MNGATLCRQQTLRCDAKQIKMLVDPNYRTLIHKLISSNCIEVDLHRNRGETTIWHV